MREVLLLGRVVFYYDELMGINVRAFVDLCRDMTWSSNNPYRSHLEDTEIILEIRVRPIPNKELFAIQVYNNEKYSLGY